MPTAQPKLDPSPPTYRPIYDEVARRLRAASWFADGWTALVGEHDKATWLGLNKEAWRNSGLEIHVESWIKKEQIAKRRVPVALHVEGGHYTRRYAFNARFHGEVAELVQNWEGYVVSEAGMTRLTVSLPLETDTFASALVVEFARMAQLGPVVDRIVDTMDQ